MARPAEPNPSAGDLPREPIRPDDGYRVGARIVLAAAGPSRLVGLVAVAVILAGVGFAALGRPLPEASERPAASIPTRAVGTPLPGLAILRVPAPTRPVPVYAGGLRWLDPADGSISGDPYSAPRSGMFVDADGRALCVCLEIPWMQDEAVTRIMIRRYGPDGLEIASAEVRELRSVADVLGQSIMVEAAIAPDGRSLWVVHTVRGAHAWEIGLDRIDLATLNVDGSLALDPIPVPEAGTHEILDPTVHGWVTDANAVVRASVRVSPDNARLAVIESVDSDPGTDPRLPKYQEARLTVPADLGAGAHVTVPAHDATDDECFSDFSAWATNELFITICSRPAGQGVQPYVRIADPGGAIRNVVIGPPARAQDTDWLLDSAHGAIYRWSRTDHVFSRLLVATEDTRTLEIDPSRVGEGELAAPPGAGTSEPPWAPLTGADSGFRPPTMAGSADGTLIYALGQRRIVDGAHDDRLASTGIWVIDAEQAALVAHWSPTAVYAQIGFAPGWGSIVTVALPGTDGNGDPADWAPSLRFHDPGSGMISEVVGNVEESTGFVPILAVPTAWRGIAGF